MKYQLQSQNPFYDLCKKDQIDIGELDGFNMFVGSWLVLLVLEGGRHNTRHACLITPFSIRSSRLTAPNPYRCCVRGNSRPLGQAVLAASSWAGLARAPASTAPALAPPALAPRGQQTRSTSSRRSRYHRWDGGPQCYYPLWQWQMVNKGSYFTTSDILWPPG